MKSGNQRNSSRSNSLSAVLCVERLDDRVLPSQSVAPLGVTPPTMPWAVEVRLSAAADAHSGAATDMLAAKASHASGGGVTTYVYRSTGEEIPQTV